MENFLSRALFKVSINNDSVLLQRLLDNNAHVSDGINDEPGSWTKALAAKDGLGRTPLMVASWHGHVQIMNELILNGSDLQETDNEGRPASDYVLCCGEGASDLKQRKRGQSMLLRSSISLATRDAIAHPTKEKIPPLV